MVTARHSIIVLFILALLVRLVLWGVSSVQLETGDQFVYLTLAETLLESGDYAITPGEPTADRLPAYSVFLAGLLALSGHGQGFVVFVQCQLGALTAVLVMHLIPREAKHGNRMRILAGLIVAGYPVLALYPAQLLSENLFLPLLIGTILLFRGFMRHPGPKAAILAGILLALLALCRNVGLIIAAAFLLAAIAKPQARRGAWIILAVFCLVYGTWVARNWAVLGTPILTSSNGGTVFYIGNGPGATGRYHESIGPLEPVTVETERSRMGFQLAWGHIRQSPVAWVGLLAKKAILFWEPYSHPVDWVAWPLFLALCVLGLIRGAGRSLGWEVWLAVAVCFALPVITHVSHRFHVPLLVLWAPLAAAGAAWLMDKLTPTSSPL